MSRPMLQMETAMPSSFTDRRPAASSLPPLGLSNVAGRLPSTYSAVSTAGMQYTHVGQQLQSEQQQQNIIRGGNLGSIPNSHGLGMSPVSAGLFSNANSTYTITPQSSTYPGSLQTSQFAPLGQSLSSMAPQPVYPSVNAPNRNYSPLDYLRNATSPAVNDGMALPPPPPGMDSSSAAVQANQQSGLQVLNSLPPLQQQAAANSMMAPPLSAALSSQSLRSPPLLGFGSSGSSNNFSPRQPTTPYSAPPYTPQHGTQFFPFNFAHSASSPSSLQDIKFNTSISNGPAGSAHPIQNSLGAPNPQAPPLAHAHSYQGGLHQYRMRSGGMNQSAMGHPVMTNLHMPGSQMSMIGGMTNGALGSSLLPQGLPSAFAGQSNVMNDGLNTMRASSVVQGMSGIQYGVATPHNLPGNPGHGSANHINGVPTHRPFQCNECSQGFNRNHDLKRHKRIHLAVKPFPCGHCPKSFSRKDALKRHILVKGCGNTKPGPHPLQSRMSSDESIQTNASFQSARSNDTAISTPDADDEPIQDPMEDVKTELSVRSTAFGMDASMELMVDQMTRSSNNCGHSAEGGSMRGASGIMIDPTAGMTLQVPSSVSIDAVDSASQARMDINGHLVGIGGTGMMANSVIGI